jgi:hypothetical protein
MCEKCRSRNNCRKIAITGKVSTISHFSGKTNWDLAACAWWPFTGFSAFIHFFLGRIYEKSSFLTRRRGQNGRILLHSRAISGSAGLSPSRNRKPEGSTLNGYARNSRRECAGFVAGQAVLTAEIRVISLRIADKTRKPPPKATLNAGISTMHSFLRFGAAYPCHHRPPART